MENYEQEIYSFLTQRQNFEPFLNLVGHYDMIRKELLEKFWESIEQKVNEKFKTSSEMSEWEARLENPLKQYTQLYCYSHKWSLKEFSPVLVSWENLAFRPYIGLWMDHNRSNEFQYESLRQNVQGFAKENDYKAADNNKFWALWRYAEIDFNKPQSLLDILPDTRDVLVEQMAEDLFGLALALQNKLSLFYNMSR